MPEPMTALHYSLRIHISTLYTNNNLRTGDAIIKENSGMKGLSKVTDR